MPYSQDSDNVECGIKTIESEISGCCLRDDECPNRIVYSSSDERMCFENADCASDGIKRPRRSLWRCLQQSLYNASTCVCCLLVARYCLHRPTSGHLSVRRT